MQQFRKVLTGAILVISMIGTGSACFGSGHEPEEGTAIEAVPSSASQFPGRVELVVGFADILRIEGDIDTIVVGNPGIADATPVDSSTVLLNGHAAGMTNLILLSQNGDILAKLMLHVSSRQPGSVTVRRALEQKVYSCASGLCEDGAPRGTAESGPAVAPPLAPPSP